MTPKSEKTVSLEGTTLSGYGMTARFMGAHTAYINWWKTQSYPVVTSDMASWYETQTYTVTADDGKIYTYVNKISYSKSGNTVTTTRRLSATSKANESVSTETEDASKSQTLDGDNTTLTLTFGSDAGSLAGKTFPMKYSPKAIGMNIVK